MSEIRQQIGAAFPRPRRSGGVVSYVAELQQIDEETAPATRPRPELPSGLTLEFEPVPGRGRRPEQRREEQRPDEELPDEERPEGERPAVTGGTPLRNAAPPVPGSTAHRGGPVVPPPVRLADRMLLSDPGGAAVPPAGGTAAHLTGGTADPLTGRTDDLGAGRAAALGATPGPGAGTGDDASTAELVAVEPAAVEPAAVEPAAVELAAVPGPTGPAPAPRRRRRVRLAVLAASTAVLTAAAAGYAVTDRSAATRTALPPSRFEVPAGDPAGGADAGRAPAQGAPASVSAQASLPTEESAPVEASISAGPIVGSSVPSTAPVDPAASRSAGATARPSAAATRPVVPPGDPATSPPPAELAPARPEVADLTATFTRKADVLPLGLGGYVGTIRLDNPGDVDAIGWRLRLTVPGGNQVVPGPGVNVLQSGELVFFRPQPSLSTVTGGGSVSFTFTVNGVLVSEPTGCLIDGNPCD